MAEEKVSELLARELERQTENLSFILNRVGEDVLHQWHGKFDRELREAQALLSALSALSASPSPPKADGHGEVSVKPLEWSERHVYAELRGGETVMADTMLGRYQVWGDGAWTSPHEFHNPGAERGLEVGKTAAQSDYEARILSALVSPSIKREA